MSHVSSVPSRSSYIAGVLVAATLFAGCHRIPNEQRSSTAGESVGGESAGGESAGGRSAPEGRSPAITAQELLDADRHWSREAAGQPFPRALGAMFADSLRMPARDRVVQGAAAVMAMLAATPDSGATVRWVPVRAGIAADGQHGFTAGVQFLTRRNGERVAARYLAYWVRDGERTWKAVAWRRRSLGNVTPDTTLLPPLIPERLAPRGDVERVAMHNASLIAAEQGFSDTANRIGVGAAFAQLGDAEALNMGAPDQPSFVRGAAAIATLVAGSQPLDAPSTITWRADDAIVASSGDLGITFGVIRSKSPPANGAGAGAAFFTIWRRASPGAPWRYVAE